MTSEKPPAAPPPSPDNADQNSSETTSAERSNKPAKRGAANPAQLGLWETNISQFSLAQNRVVGFMVGLVAGMLVAWFAIERLERRERPGTVAEPIIVATDNTKSRLTPSPMDATDKGRPPDAGAVAAPERVRNTQTVSDSSNRRGLSGFANRNLASEARKIPASSQSELTENSFVNRPIAPQLTSRPRRLPPLPGRNTKQQTVIIDLPERRPARKVPPPPGTIEARATNPFDEDSRMGIGLNTLTIERRPPCRARTPPTVGKCLA